MCFYEESQFLGQVARDAYSVRRTDFESGGIIFDIANSASLFVTSVLFNSFVIANASVSFPGSLVKLLWSSMFLFFFIVSIPLIGSIALD